MGKDQQLYRMEGNRRDMLRTAGAAMIAGLGASGVTPSGPVAAQAAPEMSPVDRNNGPLGVRLQGIQHFGVTVQNMDRSFEFYTEVLGGTEVMRDGDFTARRSITRFSWIKTSSPAKGRWMPARSVCPT